MHGLISYGESVAKIELFAALESLFFSFGGGETAKMTWDTVSEPGKSDCLAAKLRNSYALSSSWPSDWAKSKEHFAECVVEYQFSPSNS